MTELSIKSTASLFSETLPHLNWLYLMKKQSQIMMIGNFSCCLPGCQSYESLQENLQSKIRDFKHVAFDEGVQLDLQILIIQQFQLYTFCSVLQSVRIRFTDYRFILFLLS